MVCDTARGCQRSIHLPLAHSHKSRGKETTKRDPILEPFLLTALLMALAHLAKVPTS